MLLQAFFQKSILLPLLVSILFGLAAIADSSESSESESNESFSRGQCKSFSRKCKKIIVRKEWYTLSNTEKKDYLDAVTCLSRKPSLPEIHSKFPGTQNRYDDFVAVHANQAPYIHWVGFFMAWHRYFVAVYEKALREECNYKGAHPYWNVANDIASGRDMNQWDIFSNTTGFGDNGPYDPNPPGPNQFNLTGSGGGCVPAGPFGVGSTFKVNFDLTGDISTSRPQCLRRSFAWPNITQGVQKNVDILLNQPNFTMFNERIDPIITTGIPSIHSSVHAGIGGGAGPFSNAFVSPAEPLFYMHHANMDRIYWQWQMQNPGKRLCEIGGPIIPFDYTPTKGPLVTLDFQINIDVMGPSIPVRDILSTFTDPWCYVYDRVY